MNAALAPHPAAIRRSHERSCAAKLAYPTRAHAHAVALWMMIVHREDFTEYRCRSRHWHVGHTEPLPRKRRITVGKEVGTDG